MHYNKLSSFLFILTNTIIGILSGLLWLFALFGFDDKLTATLTVLAILIHELGHECALLLLGKSLKLPLPKADGFRIKMRQILSYKEEITVCLAGPLANLTAALVSRLFLGQDAFFGLFSAVNLITAISNLLPIKNYDGYKILSAILNLRQDSADAVRVLDGISFFLAIAAVFISLYIIYALDAGYWIFGVFFIFLLNEVKNSLNS